MATTTTTPISTRPGLTEPRAGVDTHVPAVASLRRLLPYARPALPALILSALAALIATLCAITFPLVIQYIIDGPISAKNMAGLWVPGTVLLVLGVVEAALVWARRMLSARPTMRVEAAMRAAFYDHLQKLPIAFHDRWPAGQLMSRAVADLAAIRRFLAFGLVFLVVNLTTILVGLAILLVLSRPLGLIIALMAVPMVALCFRYETRYQVLARRSQDQVGDLATMVEESVLGIRILKAFGRSGHYVRLFAREAAELQTTELTKARVVAKLWASIIVVPELAFGLTLYLGIQQVASGAMSEGTLVAFFGIALGLRWPIDSIGWLLAMTNDAASATQRYFEVMNAPVTITSPHRPVRTDAPRRGHLRFEAVRFRFADTPAERSDLLRGVDLDIRPGETIALVGATGSGKTTLTALVNRLYDVTGGRVTLDGTDIRTLDLADLRRRIAVAFEEPTLFSASIRENVLLGSPGSTDDQVWAALQLAQADFVAGLPWGLDTRIGEQGLSLSGGQRQRLALARAVVGRPEVLVLDDPLSALDIHTESKVEQALRSVLTGTTALIVAHRASTVLLADRVALLAGGRVAAVGTHPDLLSTNPDYRNLLSGPTGVRT